MSSLAGDGGLHRMQLSLLMQHCTSLRYIIKVEEAYQMTFSAWEPCQGVLMAENEDVCCRLPVIQHVTSHLQLFHLLHEHYNMDVFHLCRYICLKLNWLYFSVCAQ